MGTAIPQRSPSLHPDRLIQSQTSRTNHPTSLELPHPAWSLVWTASGTVWTNLPRTDPSPFRTGLHPASADLHPAWKPSPAWTDLPPAWKLPPALEDHPPALTEPPPPVWTKSFLSWMPPGSPSAPMKPLTTSWVLTRDGRSGTILWQPQQKLFGRFCKRYQFII